MKKIYQCIIALSCISVSTAHATHTEQFKKNLKKMDLFACLFGCCIQRPKPNQDTITLEASAYGTELQDMQLQNPIIQFEAVPQEEPEN